MFKNEIICFEMRLYVHVTFGEATVQKFGKVQKCLKKSFKKCLKRYKEKFDWKNLKMVPKKMIDISCLIALEEGWSISLECLQNLNKKTLPKKGEN